MNRQQTHPRILGRRERVQQSRVFRLEVKKASLIGGLEEAIASFKILSRKFDVEYADHFVVQYEQILLLVQDIDPQAVPSSIVFELLIQRLKLIKAEFTIRKILRQYRTNFGFSSCSRRRAETPANRWLVV